MNWNRIMLLGLSAAAALLGAAGCRESVAPGSSVPAVPSLSRVALRDSVDISASVPIPDSVAVSFPGLDATTAARVHWSVSRGQAPWITLLTTSGSGDGMVRWTRDPGDLGYGNWVDTITVATADGGAAHAVDSLTVGGAPPAFVAQKRPWLPGERDSMISFVTATNAAGPYSFALAQLFAVTDSVSVVVPNPALAAAHGGGAAPSRLAHLGQAGQTWVLVPLQIHEVFPDSTGSSVMDSITWLGVFWYASPESTWIGQVLAQTAGSTIHKAAVNTSAFDTSSSTTSGLVGGGEARASTGQYWEANSGQLWIKTNACSPGSCANNTFTSGPFQGGVWHGILVGGQLISIVAPCVSAGCAAPPDTFSLAFGSTGKTSPVSGLYISCVFPSPCTGAPAARLVALLRKGVPMSKALLMDVASPARDEKRGEVRR